MTVYRDACAECARLRATVAERDATIRAHRRRSRVEVALDMAIAVTVCNGVRAAVDGQWLAAGVFALAWAALVAVGVWRIAREG